MRLIYFLVCFLLIAQVQANATTWYVSATGSNSNPCTGTNNATNPSFPKQTIAAGLSCVSNTLGAGAGHVVQVAPGVYNESLNMNGVLSGFPTGTSWSTTPTNAFFTLRCVDGSPPWTVSNTCIIRSSTNTNMQLFSSSPFYSLIQGFQFDAINQPNGSSSGQVYFGASGIAGNFIRFQNNELINNNHNVGIGMGSLAANTEILNNRIHGGTWNDPFCTSSGCNLYPIYASGPNNLFDGNEIYNFASFGIHGHLEGIDPATGQSNTFNNNVISNNSFHDFGATGASAIIVSTGSGNRVYNNIIYNGTASHGIQVADSNSLIYSNTIYNLTQPAGQPGGGGIVAFQATNTTIKNNIMWNVHHNDFSGGGTTQTNNLCSTGGCAVTGDPLFVQVSTGDFRLCTAAGQPQLPCTGASPALNVGATLGSPYNVDRVGTARPQPSGGLYDLGAYEMSTTVTPPGCPTTPALVASYGFEGNGTDSSGKGNTAAVGTGLSYAAGKYGQGVLFDGAHAVTVAHSTSLFLCTGWTISASIKLPSPLASVATLVSSDWSASDGWFLYAGESSTGTPFTGYIAAGTFVAANYGTLLSSGSFVDVAVTYDSTLPSQNIKLWVNGVNVTSADGQAVLADWTGSMRIGGSQVGEYIPSGSVVDEVRIYNYAQTQAQLNADQSTPIVSTATSSYVKFGAGSTIFKMGAGASSLKIRGQ